MDDRSIVSTMAQNGPDDFKILLEKCNRGFELWKENKRQKEEEAASSKRERDDFRNTRLPRLLTTIDHLPIKDLRRSLKRLCKDSITVCKTVIERLPADDEDLRRLSALQEDDAVIKYLEKSLNDRRKQISSEQASLKRKRAESTSTLDQRSSSRDQSYGEGHYYADEAARSARKLIKLAEAVVPPSEAIESSRAPEEDPPMITDVDGGQQEDDVDVGEASEGDNESDSESYSDSDSEGQDFLVGRGPPHSHK